jgi:hypothetical protein
VKYEEYTEIYLRRKTPVQFGSSLHIPDTYFHHQTLRRFQIIP